MDAETLVMVEKMIKDAVEEAIKAERKRLSLVLRSSDYPRQHTTWVYEVASRIKDD
jgi:hypothetical protein